MVSRLFSLLDARNVFPVPADLLDKQSNLSAAYLGNVNHKGESYLFPLQSKYFINRRIACETCASESFGGEAAILRAASQLPRQNFARAYDLLYAG